jgi:hypothetical protein
MPRKLQLGSEQSAFPFCCSQPRGSPVQAAPPNSFSIGLVLHSWSLGSAALLLQSIVPAPVDAS